MQFLKQFYAALSNRLHLWRCAYCGKRIKNWKPVLNTKRELPVCPECEVSLLELFDSLLGPTNDSNLEAAVIYIHDDKQNESEKENG